MAYAVYSILLEFWCTMILRQRYIGVLADAIVMGATALHTVACGSVYGVTAKSASCGGYAVYLRPLVGTRHVAMRFK